MGTPWVRVSCPSRRHQSEPDGRRRIHWQLAGDGADFLVVRDLVQKVRQNRAVTLAAGCEFHGPDVARRDVHGQMDLAVLALT